MDARENECQVLQNYILHIKFSEFYLCFHNSYEIWNPFSRTPMRNFLWCYYTQSINQSIRQFINVMGWGCTDHPSQRLMYKTHDSKDTKSIKIQCIWIKIILKDHRCMKTNNNNIRWHFRTRAKHRLWERLSGGETSHHCRP